MLPLTCILEMNHRFLQKLLLKSEATLVALLQECVPRSALPLSLIPHCCRRVFPYPFLSLLHNCFLSSWIKFFLTSRVWLDLFPFLWDSTSYVWLYFLSVKCSHGYWYLEICHVSVAMTMLRSMLLHRKEITNENVSVDTVVVNIQSVFFASPSVTPSVQSSFLVVPVPHTLWIILLVWKPGR